MTRVQKILVALVLAEAVCWSVLRLGKPSAAPLSEFRKDALDAITVRQIQDMEESLRPDQPNDWLRLAEVYRAFNLLAAAEHCYGQADRISPLEGTNLLAYAVTLSRMGELQRAADSLQRALKQGIEQTNECRLMRARDRLRAEDAEGAVELLRKLEPSPEGTLLLARTLVRTGRAREAVPILEDWLRLAPDDLRARQMRSWAAAALEDETGAETHRGLAQRCQDWSPHHDSVTAFDQSVRSQFGYWKLLAEAQNLETQGKTEEALARMRQVLSSAWSQEDARRLAALLLGAGRTQEAIDELEQLINVAGPNGETLLLLGQAWLSRENPSKAREFALRAERLGANQTGLGNLQVQRFLVSLSTQLGDTNAVRIHQARVQFELGKQAWLQNDVLQAGLHFRRSTSLLPEWALGWYYLGDTSEARGDLVSARQYYRRCLQLEPDHGRALTALERLSKL